jgi:hypothetical protein
MSRIAIGVNYTDAVAIAEKQKEPAPDGVYTLEVKGYEEGLKTKKKNKAMIRFDTEVINHPDEAINGKKIGIFVVLPEDGDMTSIRSLVDFSTGFGKPWDGDYVDGDDYLGARAEVNLETSDDGKWNQLESYVG